MSEEKSQKEFEEVFAELFRETQEQLNSLPLQYVLDDNGEPMKAKNYCENLRLWEKNHRKDMHIVAKTMMGDYLVSTVFLFVDHGWGGHVPILWETMVFKGSNAVDLDCERCGGSREQAEAQHKRVVKR